MPLPPMDQHTDRKAQMKRRVRVFMMLHRWYLCRLTLSSQIFPDGLFLRFASNLGSFYMVFPPPLTRPDPHDQMSLWLAEVSNVNTSAPTCHEKSHKHPRIPGTESKKLIHPYPDSHKPFLASIACAVYVQGVNHVWFHVSVYVCI